jgi:hypothetical protein
VQAAENQANLHLIEDVLDEPHVRQLTVSSAVPLDGFVLPSPAQVAWIG